MYHITLVHCYVMIFINTVSSAWESLSIFPLNQPGSALAQRAFAGIHDTIVEWHFSLH
jgi:hypothetical protein